MNLGQDKKKAAPVKQTDVKRTRRDRGELEDIMFKLFERQPNWALKQLVQETDQPAVSGFACCVCVHIFTKENEVMTNETRGCLYRNLSQILCFFFVCCAAILERDT